MGNRAENGYTLRLTTREFPYIPIAMFRQPDAIEQFSSSLAASPGMLPVQQHWQRYVFFRIQVANQMALLEDKTEILTSQLLFSQVDRPTRFAAVRNLRAFAIEKLNRTRHGNIKQTKQMHQSTLADARVADHRDSTSPGYLHREILEWLDNFSCLGLIRLADVGQDKTVAATFGLFLGRGHL